jgi:hypothetical protein
VLVVSLGLLGAVAVRPIFFPPTNPRITRENVGRIKEGMTREEVEAILGPAGDYRTGPTGAIGGQSEFLRDTESLAPPLWWVSDDAQAMVWFVDGKVWLTLVNSMEPGPVGLFELLRWRWNRWRDAKR